FLFLIPPRPPCLPPFPYTTLFRSGLAEQLAEASIDLVDAAAPARALLRHARQRLGDLEAVVDEALRQIVRSLVGDLEPLPRLERDRKSTRLNSSHVAISYAVFCLK